MCQKLTQKQLRSRWHWFDLPAALLLHRPVRCPICRDRGYVLMWRSVPMSIFPRLWMSYAAVLLTLASVQLWLRPDALELVAGLSQTVLSELSQTLRSN